MYKTPSTVLRFQPLSENNLNLSFVRKNH